MQIFNKLILALIFFFPLFFLPFSFEPIEFNKLYFLLFLSWILLFYLVISQLVRQKEVRFSLNKIDFLVFLFFLSLFPPFFFSRDRLSSFFGNYGLFNDGILAFFSLFLFFVLVRQKSFKNETLSYKKILNSLLFSSFLVALFSFFSLFSLWQKIPFLNNLTPFSPATESLHFLAGFLSLMVVVGLAIYLTKKDKEKKEKIFWFIYFFISLFLILALSSQRAMSFLALVSFLFVVLAVKEKVFLEEPYKLIFIIFIFFASLFFSFLNFKAIFFYVFQKIPFPQLIPEAILPQRESFEIAFKSLTSSLKSLLFGSGPGTFLENFTLYKPERILKSNLWSIRFLSSGNFVAEILSTHGLLNSIIFLLLLFFLFLISLIKKWGEEDFPIKIFFLSIAFLPFFFPKNFLFFFLIFLAISILASILASKEKRISFKDSPLLALFFETILVLFFFLFFGALVLGAKFYLGDYFYKKGFLEKDLLKKIEFFQKAINLNPWQPYYRMALSQVLILKTKEELVKENPDQILIQGFLASAVENAKRAKELSLRVIFVENLANTYRELINLAQGAEEYAKKNYEEAISFDPKNPFLYNELGKIEFQLGNLKNARENFKKAQELAPFYLEPKIQLSLLLEAEGKSEEAILELENLTLDFPSAPELFYQLGNLYLRKENLEKAIENYYKAISLFPNFSNARFSLAIALEKKGEFSLALEQLKIVESLNPENWVVKNKIREIEEKIKSLP